HLPCVENARNQSQQRPGGTAPRGAPSGSYTRAPVAVSKTWRPSPETATKAPSRENEGNISSSVPKVQATVDSSKRGATRHAWTVSLVVSTSHWPSGEAARPTTVLGWPVTRTGRLTDPHSLQTPLRGGGASATSAADASVAASGQPASAAGGV